MGVEEAIIPWPLLSRSAGTSEPASTQAATTNINPNATMNAIRIQASPTPCSGCGRGRPRRSILRAALIVLTGVPPTSSSTPMGTELGSKSGMKGKY